SMKYRGKKKEEVKKTADYFEKNQERMRYDKFRRQGLFIGSGVVEAGCKSVIGKRLKQSGMHWSVRGANSIIALRCCLESGRFEDYWEQRQAA
ncbi:MAG: ISKra4 family transposase, partial [bacterium]